MRLLWLILGLIALVLGGVGVFLPLLPTVPFLLLAAIFFSKSSENLHNWLISHSLFGPPIEDWQRSGSISRRAKFLATVSIAAAYGLSFGLGFGATVLIIQAVALGLVLLFIWTRPAA